ncbi:mechanosensitive ion channel [Crenobacter sp. SG2305]|uniref:mechanosensitive ion channel family protein n=1 Tax=Crenobacter oryzisoli TaxID=3056844 RepID=UPI0025AA4202|nr:mechanosensitive ion channel domain-containing protein [Crenobacter sp. SG2305]MDN0084797.1 mechanosensitive ion channel [Crenobacter sp. SG2305]
MLIYHRDTLTLNILLGALETKAGLVELAIGLFCVFVGWHVARYVYRRWFATHPGRFDLFLPYLLFRLVLPMSSQVLVILSTVVWVLLLGRSGIVLPIMSAMLFWFGAIRVLTAVVRQVLPQGKLERHSEHVLATTLWIGFISWAIGFDHFVLDWLDSVAFTVGKTRLSLLTMISTLLWVSVIMICSLWVSKLAEARVMKLQQVDLNLRIVITKLLRTVLVVVGVLVALPVLGVDLSVLSVFGGALGVGLGFGLQKIASNYVSGFIILLDRSIRVGDRLMVDNRVGYVSKLTSRYVVLKGLDGSEALVPNDTLISNTVLNQSYSDKAMWASLSIQVGYSTDLDVALGILAEAAKEHPRVMRTPGPGAYVTAFAESGINLDLGFWVADPENGFMGLKSDLYLAIWRRFKQEGIEIPFPQREVRILADGSQPDPSMVASALALQAAAAASREVRT